jgi:uncharacterized protein with HEPN domain
MHKKRKRKLENFLEDILEQINDIENEMENLSFDEFKANNRIQKIIEYSLLIIGEAVSNIDLETLLRAKDDPIYWRIIKDMRNRLIHHYWGTSLEIVYDTAKNEIKELKEAIRKIKNLTTGW